MWGSLLRERGTRRREYVFTREAFNHLFDAALPINPAKPYLRLWMKLPFQAPGTCVDVETLGLPDRVIFTRTSVVRAPLPEIVALGLSERGLLRTYLAWDPLRLEEFRRICWTLLKGLPKPFQAYPAHFERDFLGWSSDEWRDLLRYGYREADWHEEGGYSYRMTCSSAAYEAGLRLPNDDVRGGSIPHLWKRWVNRGDTAALKEIAYHSVSDVIRTVWLGKEKMKRWC